MNNSFNRKLQPTEDLIVAILLGNSVLESMDQEKVLKFQILPERVKVLENFIDLNQLTYLPLSSNGEGTYILRQNTVLKRIMVDLMTEEKLVYIDPALLNVNMYMLWFCLFGYKGDRKVYVSSNIDDKAKQTLIDQLQSTLQLQVSAVSKRFIVHSASRLAYLSIIHKRPQYETSILVQMANENERRKLNLLIEQQVEGGIQDVKYRL